MKIKLAGGEEFLYVSTVNRTHVYDGERGAEVDVTAREVLNITIENPSETMFNQAVSFFEKGDLSTLFIYSNIDVFISAISGLKIQSISQSFNEAQNVIYITLIVE